ncbi:MAG: tetratricopeptide repeat protein, partial [Blastocatellia bacterium]
FMRIREDHNLIATLNTLAEAAMRKGNDLEAITALQELCRLEPDEQMHRQRLYNLGVKDIAEPGAPDVVRATGPLDYGSAAFDDAFIIRQVSEAEILVGHGQTEHALMMLKEILTHAPDNIQVHLKLKDIYLRTDSIEQAASECLELSRIFDGRGESTKASDYLAEAQQLNPLIETPRAASSWSSNGHNAESDFDLPVSSPQEHGGGAFEMRELTGGLDLSRYETGALGEQLGFVTLPAEKAGPVQDSPRRSEPPPQEHAFRYSDTLAGDSHLGDSSEGFAIASELPSDTMPGALRDELEGVDFYIAQGYVEIAHDTLDRLREEHGEHPEIIARYKRLGLSASPTQSISLSDTSAGSQEDGEGRPASSFTTGELVRNDVEEGSAFIGSVPNVQVTGNGGASTGELLPIMNEPASEAEADEFLDARDMAEMVDMVVDVKSAPKESETRNAGPFLIQKQSGPLNEDLLVKLNTTDLFDEMGFDSPEIPAAPLETVEEEAVEPEVIEEEIIEEEVGAPIEDLFEAEVEEPVEEIGEEPAAAVYQAVEIDKPERISLSGRLLPETAEPPVRPAGTAELLESLMSGIDDVFMGSNRAVPQEPVKAVQAPPEEEHGFATLAEEQHGFATLAEDGQTGFAVQQETHEPGIQGVEAETEVSFPGFEQPGEIGFGTFEESGESTFFESPEPDRAHHPEVDLQPEPGQQPDVNYG